MVEAGSAFGLKCPKCGNSYDIIGSVGSDPEICNNCGTKMVPNEEAKISANVTCSNCGSSFGLINSDTCPNCKTPF